jgi:outer membrane receptor protein involved in Fe transport
MNVPLIDGKLGLRFSTSYRHDGGYVNRTDFYSGNVLQPGSNFSDTSTFRLAVAYKPLDNLTITPSFYWQGQYFNDSSLYWQVMSHPGRDDYNRSSNIRNQATDRFSLPALKIDWALGDDLALTSNTSYFQRTQLAVQDLAFFEAALWAGSPYYPNNGMYAPSRQNTRQRNFTQEVRLQSVDSSDRFVWTTGLFYTNNWQNAGQQVEDTFLPALIADNLPTTFEDIFHAPLLDGKYTVIVGPFTTVDKQIAWFGQTDIKITPKFIGTLGLRVSRTTFDSDITYDGPIITAGGPPIRKINSASTTPITPKFGLSYQITDGQMIYTSVSKGFRSGGANNPVAAACGDDLTKVGLTKSPDSFKDDSLWSYEIGTKMRGLNGRLAIDASAYLIKWNDIQFIYTLPGCGFDLTTNAGKATSRGLELTVQARPLDNFDVGVAVGYTHASYDATTYFGGKPADPNNPSGAITGGGDRILVAPLTVSLNAQVTFPILEHDSYFRVNYNYADGLNSDLPRHDQRTGTYDPDIPGLPVLNDVTLKLGTHLGPVDLSVYLNNALDQSPILSRSHATIGTDLYFISTVRPRTGGITAAYKF